MNKESRFINQTKLEEQGSSFAGDSVEEVCFSGSNLEKGVGINGVFSRTLLQDGFSEFYAPVKTLRYLRIADGLIPQDKEEKVVLCLSNLVSFLRVLSLKLFDLCIQPDIDPRKLAVLSDEAAELQGVAREALACFYEMTRSVKKSFESSDGAPSDPAYESNDHCDNNSSSDVMPIKSEHEDDITPFV